MGEHDGEDEHHEVQDVKFVILDLTSASHVDTSALHTLQEIRSTFRRENDVELCLANPNPRVMHKLVQSGLADEIDRDRIFVSLNDAVHYCLDHMHSREIKKRSSAKDLQACAGNGAHSAVQREDDASATASNADAEIGLDVDNV